VTSPLWIPIAFVFGMVLIILAIIVIALLLGFNPEQLTKKIEKYKKKD
jgi:K+-transporting ATPase A subunit